MTTPEAQARQNIDAQLSACGWVIQDRKELNLYAGRGVAVREFPLETGIAVFEEEKRRGLDAVPALDERAEALLPAPGGPLAVEARRALARGRRESIGGRHRGS